MKKFLIYFCLILSLFMCIPNTYCLISNAPNDYYEFSFSTLGLPTQDVSSDNYVNNSYSDVYNQCYYTNFDVKLTSSASNATPSSQYFFNLQFDQYPSWFTESYYVYDTWYPFGTQYAPYIDFTFHCYRYGDRKAGIRCVSYTLYNFEDFKLPFNYTDVSYSNYYLPFYYEPGIFYDAYWDSPTLDVNVLSIDYMVKIDWSFDFICPSGYYYDNTFGICLKPHLVNSGTMQDFSDNQVLNFDVNFISNDNLTFNYNYSNTLYKYNYTNDIYNFVILKNNYNYTYDYIKSFNIHSNINNKIVLDNFGISQSFILNLSIPNLNGWERRMVVSYTDNSIKYGNSSIISVGGNNYYRSGEWWDVTVHIYNLFIYLIFDAPIVSDVIQFINILISFIVDTFEWFISLFSGVDNLIFISIFLGYIVLSFIFKLIL